ncbi:MAG TPA: thioredoxin domain-containing protein [Solirubrobacterales bacterium]
MNGSEERRRRLLQLVSAAAFLAVAVVLVLIVVNSSETDGGDTELEGVATAKRELRGIPQDGLALGEPVAEVTLYEYGDLQCPVCKGFAEDVVPDVIEAKVRSGEARIEFRNFTIINEESVPAAAAAIAAGEQTRGWDFLDVFYANQGQEATGYVTDEFLAAIARAVGVPDIARWDEERESPVVLRRVQHESEEAQRLGLTGTPSFAVTGPSIEGKEVLGTPGSAEALEEAIEAAG